MKAVDLAENIWIVQFDVSKADETVGMLVDIFAGFRETFWSDEQDTDAVGGIQFGEQLIEHAGLAVKVLVYVDKFGLGRLGEGGERGGEQEQDGYPCGNAHG